MSHKITYISLSSVISTELEKDNKIGIEGKGRKIVDLFLQALKLFEFTQHFLNFNEDVTYLNLRSWISKREKA